MNLPEHREHLREAIRLKRALDVQADRQPPAPFPGWTTRGNLPHCDEPALIQFVTYRLVAWVIMPNHVHLLVDIWDKPLAGLVKSWKGYSARQINRVLGRTGAPWQEEYWDRYIRNEEHFQKALRYVQGNPARARLVLDPADWPFSSANPRWTWTARDSRSRYRDAHLDTELWKRRMAPTPALMEAADVAVRAPNGTRAADVAVRAPNMAGRIPEVSS